MNKQLTEIAEEVDDRLSQLSEEESGIKARLSEIQKEKTEMDAARDRIKLFRSGDVSRLVCLRCYILQGIDSEMNTMGSNLSEADLFRCTNCGEEVNEVSETTTWDEYSCPNGHNDKIKTSFNHCPACSAIIHKTVKNETKKYDRKTYLGLMDNR